MAHVDWFGKTKVLSNQKLCYTWVNTGGVL